MFLRRLTLLLFLLSALLWAQASVGRNAHGIRVPSAHTLEQGHLYFSGAVEIVSDGEPLTMDGFVNETTGEQKELEEQTASSGGDVQFSYGLFDMLELDLLLPIYYEASVEQTDLEGMGIGDFQASLKAGLPLPHPFYVSVGATVLAPSGSKTVGFRPRQSWIMKEKSDSYAYTSGNWAVAGNLYITLDILGFALWNNNFGYLKTFNDESDVLLWGTGVEFLHQKMISPILEISGEARLKKVKGASEFWNEPVRLTPGVRIHLPQKLDILVGADIGLDFVKERNLNDGFEIHRKSGNDKLKYTIPGTPQFGFVFGLTKTIDFSWKDSDRDGVVDRLDMCPGSAFGVLVNSRGCPVDQDQDGVLNIVDDCPDTPYGIEVDFFGCPLDEDRDSIPDYQDQCPGTPPGKAVDSRGCVRDTDGDGIDDNNDLCPNTSREEQVDTTGCPIDEDHDGVLNAIDKCPNTPKGWSVDEFGCPLDYDEDGVPDEIDKCPNTPKNEKITEDGCPIDEDRDGVPDSRDQCPATPSGFQVYQNGCPTDHDEDGIPDALDKCPNTPRNAPTDSTGCPLDSDNDGVADYLDKCPATFPHVLVNSLGCPYDSKLNLNTLANQIEFKSSGDKILKGSHTALNDVIELMRRYSFNLEVQCSASGPNAQALSEARAKAIAEYFDRKGFEDDQVKVQGFGSSLPQGPEYKGWNATGIRLIPIGIKK